MIMHTPAPWRVDAHMNVMHRDGMVAFPCISGGFPQEANARLIASAPDLLAAVESEYIFLADIHNEWPGRHSADGQQKLCRLRDLICKATGREAQEVQDDYGNRNFAKAEGKAA